MFIVSRRRKDLDSSDPEKRTEADNRILPTGILPTNGWLLQAQECEHSLQANSTFSEVPSSVRTVLPPLRQYGQCLNSSRRQDWNTMNFLSWCATAGSSDDITDKLQSQGTMSKYFTVKSHVHDCDMFYFELVLN